LVATDDGARVGITCAAGESCRDRRLAEWPHTRTLTATPRQPTHVNSGQAKVHGYNARALALVAELVDAQG
jgi:hypothetical protein